MQHEDVYYGYIIEDWRKENQELEKRISDLEDELLQTKEIISELEGEQDLQLIKQKLNEMKELFIKKLSNS